MALKFKIMRIVTIKEVPKSELRSWLNFYVFIPLGRNHINGGTYQGFATKKEAESFLERNEDRIEFGQLKHPIIIRGNK